MTEVRISFFFFLLKKAIGIPCKAEQLLRDIELQEKETRKG